MAKKPHLSVEEHKEMGLALCRIRSELLTRSVQIARAYPKRHKAVTALHAAYVAVDKARDLLSSEAVKEFWAPVGQDGWSIYYHNANEQIQRERRELKWL